MKTNFAWPLPIVRFLEDCLEFGGALRELMLTQAAKERRWVKKAKEIGATHVVVLWESSEMNYLPRYVRKDENIRSILKNIQQAGAFSVVKVITLSQIT